MVEHFETLAEAAPVPSCSLSNIPQNTGHPLPIEEVRRLAAHDNIAGIKDSSADLTYFRGLLTLAGPNLTVLYGGDERLATTTTLLGAMAVSLDWRTSSPGTMRALRDALARRDHHEANRIQSFVDAVLAVTAQGFWLSGLNAAVALLDGGTGRPAPPLPPATEEQRRAIHGILAETGVLDQPCDHTGAT